jgi:hypothetical protein
MLVLSIVFGGISVALFLVGIQIGRRLEMRSNYAAALRIYNEYRLERFSPYSQPPSFYNWLRQRLPSEELNAPQNS